MLLEINENKTVGDLQEKFNDCFPYLKLEFYTKAHGWHERSTPAAKISPRKKIGEISRMHRQGVLRIQSGQKIGLVEKTFKKDFGLFVQVCYQVNDTWIETKDTDDLTLQQLCCMAEQADLQY